MSKWFACLITVFISGLLYATDATESTDVLPEPLHANWAFSGVVTSESGENYGYFFQMQRDGDEYHTLAALFDGQNKQPILLEESQATIPNSAAYNWHVGRAFLRFNPINNSWIFGLKTQDKKGFNFKVDMLKQSETTQASIDLRQGVELLVNQTSHLNGHIQAGEGNKEEFVTAKNAWFRQVWLKDTQEKSQPFSGVLCRFNDGSGFYSVNMEQSDALRGAVAGWCDEQGVSSVMSQFINVKQDAKGPWHIRITSPNLHLVLADFIEKNSVVAGFVSEGKSPGFCMLSKEVIGKKG